MQAYDYRDLIGGTLLVTAGLFVGLYAAYHYDLGTLRHIGPGMFPAALGFVLAGIGILVALPALFLGGDLFKSSGLSAFEIRPFVAILAGILGFALTIEPFGMIPAICLLTVAAVLADNKLGVLGTLVLAASLSLLAMLIFTVGLRMPLSPVKWPF